MFLLNGLMWTLFVKSLQYCQSSVQATITNSSANFFFTVSVPQIWILEMKGTHYYHILAVKYLLYSEHHLACQQEI